MRKTEEKAGRKEKEKRTGKHRRGIISVN